MDSTVPESAPYYVQAQRGPTTGDSSETIAVIFGALQQAAQTLP
ncbi:MAG: hypothetical protein WAO58_06800 [Fimbriimonadaceae bacterium]